MTVDEGMWVIGYGSLIFKPPPYVSFKVSGYLDGFVRRFWQSSIDHRGTKDAPGRVVTLISLEDLQGNDKFHNDLHMYELKNHEETSFAEETSETIHDNTYKINKLSPTDLRVWGVAYYIEPENVEKAVEYLEIREQNGYTTHKVPFHVLNVFGNDHSILGQLPKDIHGNVFINSSIYIGTIDNEAFVGPENIEDTAKVIKTSIGPSGLNKEYLVKLTESIRTLDVKNKTRDYYLEDLLQLVNN